MVVGLAEWTETCETDVISADSLSGEENKTYVGVKKSEHTPSALVIKSQGVV